MFEKTFIHRYLAAAGLLLSGALAEPALAAEAGFEPRCRLGKPATPPIAAPESPDAVHLRRLGRLSLEEKIGLYLPRHLGMLQFAAGERAFDPKQQLSRFLRDPALAGLAKVEDRWVSEAAGPFVSMEALIEAKVMIARNLNRSGLAASPAAVRRAWEEIASGRIELAPLEIFAGRQVVFAVGRNDLGQGPTFGKEDTIAAIEDQQPASLEVVRATAGGARGRLAELIAKSENLTLFFETHGRPQELRWDGSLEVEELARMFAKRRSASRAILILGSCYGHDYGRALLELLIEEGIEPPILIVPEEYGQATLIGRQESPFNRQLGLSRRGNRSTFGDLLKSERRETAVYALTERGLRQLR